MFRVPPDPFVASPDRLDRGVCNIVGGAVSPVLANAYLHYVLDLWFERRFKKTCRNWAKLTRYCDDS